MFCLSDYKQLTFIDQVSELKNLSFQQPVKFLKLLKDNFDSTSFIPETFIQHYYSNLGCNRDFQLSSVLAALLIEHFFHIPTGSLLCIFLAFSPDIREFCRFDDKIPDETFFSRFKTTFEKDIANLFDSMVPYIVDQEGTPLCPLTHKPFLPDGSCKGKNRSFRLKYVCPESVRYKTNWKCTCQTPCRPTKSTVTSYKYPDRDFRMYPGIQRCSQEWDDTYKDRAVIERELSSLKKNPRIKTPRTLNTATIRADLYLAGITKLITVILAYALNQPQYLRNIRKLVRFAA